MKFFIFIVEAQRILFKDASRTQYKIKNEISYFLLLRRSVSYSKIQQVEDNTKSFFLILNVSKQCPYTCFFLLVKYHDMSFIDFWEDFSLVMDTISKLGL